jgi:formylglycine-generating enzyme required for sulfatase activity
VNANESCCAAEFVPRGSFLRDSDSDYPATISSLSLDRYEVTVRRFRAFVEAGGGTQERPPPDGVGALARVPESGWRSIWNGRLPPTRARLEEQLACTDLYRFWSPEPGPHDLRPMNCLTWYLAFAFCAWDGGRLPTEAEWLFAALGGDQQRVYPWGDDEPTRDRASFDCRADGNPDCSFTDVVLVGTLPAGRGAFGHFELAGNLLEWLLDSYDPYPVPCNDCANLRDQSDRITRGGFYGEPPDALRNDERGHSTTTLHAAQVGVRCARSR